MLDWAKPPGMVGSVLSGAPPPMTIFPPSVTATVVALFVGIAVAFTELRLEPVSM